MAYVDGFVVPVPQAQLSAYRAMARKAGKVWKEHGALDYHECVADDVTVGKRTSFPRSVKLQARRGGGLFVHRLQVTARARPHQQGRHGRPATPGDDGSQIKAMPFDGRRMFWGGFKTLVQL